MGGVPAMSAFAPTPMTAEQLFALPDNDVERWLIYGRRREKPFALRDRWHGRAMARLGYVLESWVQQGGELRGSVLCDRVECLLRRKPDVMVGIDLVYIGPELAAQAPEDRQLIEGVPILAVEILSPNDTTEE